MPGVPSGRGCEGCRKQKKRCDQAIPSCSRCRRLGIPCLGSGQRRWKFKEQYVSGEFPVICSDGKAVVPVTMMQCPPSNELSLLVNSFFDIIKPATDFRYNLAWSFGGFLDDIPPRLGMNEALDAAVLALVESHRTCCTSQPATPEFLLRYSNALGTLRVLLDDPAKAYSSETLCAVMVLLLCQNLGGVAEGRWTGHCEGAMVLLRARGHYDPQNAFERKLLSYIRGPVLVEGIFNLGLRQYHEEWEMLLGTELDESPQAGLLIRCFAHVADLKLCMTKAPLSILSPAAWQNIQRDFSSLLALAEETRKLLIDRETRIHDGEVQITELVSAHAGVQRLYGLCLAMCIVLGCAIGPVYPEEAIRFCLEMTDYTDRILELVESAAAYGPLASAWNTLCLFSAWFGSRDHAQKAVVKAALLKHCPRYTEYADTAAFLQWRDEFEWPLSSPK